MCLLLDHGLCAGEVAALTLGNFNLKAGTVVFWRDKVEKEQIQLGAEFNPRTQQIDSKAVVHYTIVVSRNLRKYAILRVYNI